MNIGAYLLVFLGLFFSSAWANSPACPSNEDAWRFLRDEIVELDPVELSQKYEMSVFSPWLTTCLANSKSKIRQCFSNIAKFSQTLARQRDFMAADVLMMEVPTQEYLDETARLTQIPQALRSPEFLKLLESEDVARARDYVKKANPNWRSSRYTSLLDTPLPDSPLNPVDADFRRLMVMVPGPPPNGPDIYMQFPLGKQPFVTGVATLHVYKDAQDPGQVTTYYSVNVSNEPPPFKAGALLPAPAPRPANMDPHRLERGSARSVFSCTSCHLNGALPLEQIAPKQWPADATAEEKQDFQKIFTALDAGKSNSYGKSPKTKKDYFDPSVFGPSLPAWDNEQQIADFVQACTEKVKFADKKKSLAKIVDAIDCTSCHIPETSLALRFPALRRQWGMLPVPVANSMIHAGRMPEGSDLDEDEKTALLSCLNDRMYGMNGNSRFAEGAFRSWLKNGSDCGVSQERAAAYRASKSGPVFLDNFLAPPMLFLDPSSNQGPRQSPGKNEELPVLPSGGRVK